MAAQLQSEREGKLYKTKPTYGEVSDALKKENLQNAVAAQRAVLQAAYSRGRVDLNNVQEVQAQAMEFMEACESAGVFPTMLSFSAALGISRQRLYAYIAENPHSATTEYLDQLRSSWAAIIAQMSLTRQADAATSIFLLKNSGQGLTDRLQVEPVQQEYGPLGPLADPEELRKRIMESVVLDDFPED